MSRKPAAVPAKKKGARKAAAAPSTELGDAAAVDTGLLGDLRQMIVEARHTAAVAVNVGLTLLYWRIGRRIREDVLTGGRAGYGEEIVATLSRQLVAEHGRGFERKNLHRMVQFAEAFPDDHTVATRPQKLSQRLHATIQAARARTPRHSAAARTDSD